MFNFTGHKKILHLASPSKVTETKTMFNFTGHKKILHLASPSNVSETKTMLNLLKQRKSTIFYIPNERILDTGAFI
jgi:hypothetical protein